MIVRIKGVKKEQLREMAPSILLKAAKALDVVLVEKEPDFQEKSQLPHTNKLVAQLEDWYFQKLNHPLDSLKTELIRKIGGKNISEQGVINRSTLKHKDISKTVEKTLRKSRINTLNRFRGILTNPGVSKNTRKLFYRKAIAVLEQAPPQERIELVPVFMEIRDLVDG